MTDTPLTDERLAEIDKWLARRGEVSERAPHEWQADTAIDYLKMTLAEVRRLRGVIKWEGDHQRACLEPLGLADEFPWGCDAIEHVAEALIGRREKCAALESELTATRAAVAEESKRADELKSQAQKVSARQQRALDWLMRRYVGLRHRADRAEQAARELRQFLMTWQDAIEPCVVGAVLDATAWLDEAEVRDG